MDRIACNECGEVNNVFINKNLVEFTCLKCKKSNWILEISHKRIVYSDDDILSRRTKVVAELISYLGLSVDHPLELNSNLWEALRFDGIDKELFSLLFDTDDHGAE